MRANDGLYSTSNETEANEGLDEGALQALFA